MELWGWIALAVNGVVLVVLLVVGDAVREFVKSRVTTAIVTIERRFSGSRLVRTRSLRRYRHNVSQQFSSVPVPFELPADIPMRDVYIPLRAADQPEGTQADCPVDLAKVIANRRRVLVLGPPGCGKSLFLRYLLWSSCSSTNDSAGQGVGWWTRRRRWSHGGDNEPSPVPTEQPLLAVAVPLSRLAESNDIHAEITMSFARHAFPGASDFVRRALDRGDLMVLFDGLDEVGSQKRLDVAGLIDDVSRQYPRLRFVVTCRTQVYGGALDGVVDKVLHVQPFSDDLVERFLRAWPAMSSPEAVDRLVNVLRHTPRVALLVRNPLLLTMLAYLYSSEYNESTNLLPHNRTQFYRDASELLLRRWHEKQNRFRWMDKKVVLQHLALVNQDSRSDRRGIGYEAILGEIRDVLPRVNLDAAAAKDVLDEIVHRSGLLMRLDGGERYQFAHLTMQEYFAAIELLDQPDEMLRRHRADPEGWREPVKLWCGGEQDSTDLIRGIAATDKVLALECLADATRVDDTYAETLIESMKAALVGTFTIAGDGEAIAEAFGLLASDMRPRGRAVFMDLVSRVKDPHAGHARDGAVAALAMSNLPEAAKAIGDVVPKDQALFRHLVRMGDVAVPTLVGLAEADCRQTALNAVSSLGAIATPRSAEALVPLLGRVARVEREVRPFGRGQAVSAVTFSHLVAECSPVNRRAVTELAQLTTSLAVEDALAEVESCWPRFSATYWPVWIWKEAEFWVGRPARQRYRLAAVFCRCHVVLADPTFDGLDTVGREVDQRLVLAALLFRGHGQRRFADGSTEVADAHGRVVTVGDRFQPWWFLLVRFLVRSEGIDHDALKKTAVEVVKDGASYGDQDLQLIEAVRSDDGIPLAHLLDQLDVDVRLVRHLRPDVVDRMAEPWWSVDRWWTAIPTTAAEGASGK